MGQRGVADSSTAEIPHYADHFTERSKHIRTVDVHRHIVP